jgi:hypothetical protein
VNSSQYAKYLDNLTENHLERINTALQTLEARIAQYATSAPVTDGQLFDLAWAINSRNEIRQIAEQTLLTELQSIIEEYSEVADELAVMLGSEFTRIAPETLSQLQRLSFQGFEEIANTYINTMADEMYQYTIAGRTQADMIDRLRGTINGVYQASDKDAIEELVEIANTGTAAQAKAAIDKLHTIYGADKLGNNLRRYAGVYIRDSINQFNAQATIATANEAGVDKFKYYGGNMADTRQWCREHSGKTYTRDEIYELWEQDWQGKAAGDPFIVRGGYNCRHHWLPVID